MKYAPVLIPTLNRYEHFVRCIESLKRNSYAIYTDIYISIDYPPSEKYIDGYNKIVEYVKSGIIGFNKVIYYMHEKNQGAIKNNLFLKMQVFKTYDRAIFVEDDNELSPCFLEYCDKGLEIYEKDESILGLNASSYVWCGKGFVDKDVIPGPDENNVIKRQLLFHAWATWRSTWLDMFKHCENYDVYNWGKDIKKMSKLHKISRCFYYFYIYNMLSSTNRLPWYEKDKLYPTDSVWDIYMLINDCYIIAPKVSLTRDWGVDGTGVNYKEEFENKKIVIEKKIDENNSFHFSISNPMEIDTNEIALHDKNAFNDLKGKIKLNLAYLIYLLCKRKKKMTLGGNENECK